jgi:hypothetical protein
LGKTQFPKLCSEEEVQPHHKISLKESKTKKNPALLLLGILGL